jgi:hypothetical protein
MVGGKLLISEGELDAWLSNFPVAGTKVDQAVAEILQDLHLGDKPTWQRRGPRRGA